MHSSLPPWGAHFVYPVDNHAGHVSSLPITFQSHHSTMVVCPFQQHLHTNSQSLLNDDIICPSFICECSLPSTQFPAYFYQTWHMVTFMTMKSFPCAVIRCSYWHQSKINGTISVTLLVSKSGHASIIRQSRLVLSRAVPWGFVIVLPHSLPLALKSPQNRFTPGRLSLT